MIEKFSKAFVEELVKEPVLDFKTSFGSGKGDNVAGDLLSITVTTEERGQLHLIYKSVPAEGGVNRDYTESAGLFQKENAFYSELLPLMDKLMESRGMTTPLAVPKFYGGSAERYREFICLEDLRPVLNFKMASKWTGLGTEETNLVMAELAKFHAVSYVLIKMEGEKLFERSKDFRWLKHKRFGYFPDCDASEAELFKKLYVAGTQLIQQRDPILAAKMKHFDFGSNLETILKTYTLTDSKYFPVITHGDLWVNNILFQYDEMDQLETVKFIDFQKTCRGNIYEDLQYFMFTSTTPELRQKYLQRFLNLYYDTFKLTLEGMNWPMPANFTRGAFIDGFQETSINAYRYLLLAIPFQLGIPDLNFDCKNHAGVENGSSHVNGNVNQNGHAEQNGKCKQNGDAKQNTQSKQKGHLNQNGDLKLNYSQSGEGIHLKKFFQGVLFDPLRVSLENSPAAIDRLEAVSREMVTLGFL